MHRLLLRSLFCSLVALLAVSCTSYRLAGAHEIPDGQKTAENLYFSSAEDYVYKCRLGLYSHHVSGILMIKKQNDSTHRVAFMSDFGNKLIDFEISETDFKLNYAVPDLNRKPILAFLRTDFRNLLRHNHPVSQAFEDESSLIYRSVPGKKKEACYLFYSKENGLLKQIVYTRNNKEKADFNFESKKHIFADRLSIRHKDFNMAIQLSRMTEN